MQLKLLVNMSAVKLHILSKSKYHRNWKHCMSAKDWNVFSKHDKSFYRNKSYYAALKTIECKNSEIQEVWTKAKWVRSRSKKILKTMFTRFSPHCVWFFPIWNYLFRNKFGALQLPPLPSPSFPFVPCSFSSSCFLSFRGAHFNMSSIPFLTMFADFWP